MDALHAATMRHLDTVERGNLYVRALARARRTFADDIPANSEADYRQRLADRLRDYLSFKCESMGPEGLERLLQLGRERARAAALVSYRGAGFYTSLMFLVGAGFREDPLFPWVDEQLSRDFPSEPSRIDAFHAAALKAMNQWLEPGP